MIYHTQIICLVLLKKTKPSSLTKVLFNLSTIIMYNKYYILIYKKNSPWIAKEHPEFKDKSNSYMQKLLGINSYKLQKLNIAQNKIQS